MLSEETKPRVPGAHSEASKNTRLFTTLSLSELQVRKSRDTVA